MIERAAQVDQLAFAVVGRSHSRNKGSIGETRRYAPGNVRRSGALGNIFDAAIRQRDVNLLHACAHLEEEASSLSAASCGVKAVPAVLAVKFPIDAHNRILEGRLAAFTTRAS